MVFHRSYGWRWELKWRVSRLTQARPRYSSPIWAAAWANTERDLLLEAEGSRHISSKGDGVSGNGPLSTCVTPPKTPRDSKRSRNCSPAHLSAGLIRTGGTWTSANWPWMRPQSGSGRSLLRVRMGRGLRFQASTVPFPHLLSTANCDRIVGFLGPSRPSIPGAFTAKKIFKIFGQTARKSRYSR